MTKYEEEYDVTKDILSQLLKVHKDKFEWADDNTIRFKDAEGNSNGKITLNDKKINATGGIDKDFKALLKIITDAKKKPLKAEEVADTPLSLLFHHQDKFGNVQKYKTLTLSLIEEFNKIGIKLVTVGKNLRQTATIKNELELGITSRLDNNRESCPDGYYNRLKTFLYDKYDMRVKNKDSFSMETPHWFTPLEDEEPIEMKIENMIVGKYYPERNYIHLYFNPFKMVKMSLFDETIPPILSDMFALFETIGVKQVDSSSIQEKIFVSEFLGKARDKIKQSERQLQDYTAYIDDSEKKIRMYMDDYQRTMSEIEFTKNLLATNGKGLFDEVQEVKKLPFIEKVVIEGGQIDMKFKSTYMPIPNMMRSEGSGKTFGKRFIWIGSVGFRITPDNFSVYGDVNVKVREGSNGNCHPHGSGFPQGGPCFGEGDGRNKIYDLLGSNNFIELAKMLWFWIKTYKNNGAYVKVWTSYDSVLRQGYPVFDDKGVRIKLNEPERIASGEQVELEPTEDYKDNLKKFEKAELQK